MAAQLYVNVDLMREAIDVFIVAEDWIRARKLAKELEPAYEEYIEKKYKDRLLSEGNVEQLADVGTFSSAARVKEFLKLQSFIEIKIVSGDTYNGISSQNVDISLHVLLDIIGALDLLAEQGQWIRCIEKAKSHSPGVMHKYVALYASHLLKDGVTLEALNLYTIHGVPALTQNFNVYNRIAINIFNMPNVSGPDNYNLWSQLRQILYELVS